MDQTLLKRIERYRKVGWKIEKDDIARLGIGYIISPDGNCFTFDSIRENRECVPWDVWQERDINLREIVENFSSLTTPRTNSSRGHQKSPILEEPQQTRRVL